ncbi:urease accessory protein UreD [Microbacterium hominis]|uniref:Urease accessory protein UreD n=1 Tax=Microbacterium hominis TaxID=162426 RepID=A0A7D4UAB5_9MICO|nr:urease accessory protein UreD [Microbacterium hominis]QKJ18283.1 urease accessory protein UreD [Microbacterium hominis]
MTVVEIAPRGEDVSCALSGDLVIPRLVRRRGRTAEVALVAGRAMLLPGDEARLRISVGPGCTLRLVDIGGLIAYGRPGEVGEASQWHAHIDLASGADLTWDALPTVITDAGDLIRSLRITLGSGASAMLRETLVLGRTGEAGGRLRSDTAAVDAGGPVLRDALEARGATPVPGVLGGARVMDTVLMLGRPLPEGGEPPGAVRLDLERGGTMLRHLGATVHDSPLAGFLPRTLAADALPGGMPHTASDHERHRPSAVPTLASLATLP